MTDREVLDSAARVIKNTGEWLVNELQNTSGGETESVLPDMIQAYSEMLKTYFQINI